MKYIVVGCLTIRQTRTKYTEREIARKTRTRADQHKCLPLLAFINPTPLLFKKKLYSIQKMISKFEKKNHKLVEHVETNPLKNNTLHFDQYPRLSICSNIFRCSSK